MELTKEQIERQDLVDNEIFNMIKRVNPSDIELKWNIEIISEIRDIINTYFIEKNICSEQVFYPYLEE